MTLVTTGTNANLCQYKTTKCLNGYPKKGSITAYKAIETFPAVNPVDKCTLKAAVKAFIGGKKYCLNSIGVSKYSTAEAKCRSRNAKLPMPRSSQENSDFMKVLSKMGLNPDQMTGNPVILGMMDSVLGMVIGNNFLLPYLL